MPYSLVETGWHSTISYVYSRILSQIWSHNSMLRTTKILEGVFHVGIDIGMISSGNFYWLKANKLVKMTNSTSFAMEFSMDTSTSSMLFANKNLL